MQQYRGGEFYGQVQPEYKTKRKQDVLLVVGDWNGKVGNMKEETIVGTMA